MSHNVLEPSLAWLFDSCAPESRLFPIQRLKLEVNFLFVVQVRVDKGQMVLIHRNYMLNTKRMLHAGQRASLLGTTAGYGGLRHVPTHRTAKP